MKRVNYPLNISTESNELKIKYKSIYSDAELNAIQAAWDDWKSRNHVTTISENVEQLMFANMEQLADIYVRFKALGFEEKEVIDGKTVRSSKYKELDKIFKYDHKYDSRIAGFFCDNAQDLRISSCHYCELAYVNTYVRFKNNSKTIHRHFDVDHYLPKSHCPIIGLSLFNFVPSCQVCNSRIKRDKLIGDNSLDWVKFSPTSESYDFDNNVEIKLRMYNGPDTAFRKKGEYYIHFRCKNGFSDLVDFFHLEERYEFHKPEALRIKHLKAQYPKSAQKKIARILKISESKVREDLFHEDYLKDFNRCFNKLTRDMLK